MSLPTQASSVAHKLVPKASPLSPSRKQPTPVPQKPESLSHPSLLRAHNDLLTRYAALRDAYQSLLSLHQEDVAKWKKFKRTQDEITERRRATIQAVKEKKRRRREEASALAAVKVEKEAAEESRDVFGGSMDHMAADKEQESKHVSDTSTISGITIPSPAPRHETESHEATVFQSPAPTHLVSQVATKAPSAVGLVKGPVSSLARENKVGTPSRKPIAASTPSGSTSVVAGRVSPWLGGAGVSSRPQQKASRRPDSFEEECYGPSKRSSRPAQPSPPPRRPSPPPSDQQLLQSASSRQPVSTLIRDRTMLPPPSVPSTSTSKRKAVCPPDNVPNSKRAVQVDRDMLDVRAKARYDKKAEADSMKIGKEIYQGYKGKGKAVQKDEDKHVPIDQYEINPNANGGLNYAYNQTVRKKDERKKMHATDCECCSDYWKLRGHLPAPQGPIWKDPPAKPSIEESVESDQPHRDTSRHREQWAHNPTPPGYWDIGFPNTPAVEDLNQRADEIQAAKENKIRREAKRSNGQWRKKT